MFFPIKIYNGYSLSISLIIPYSVYTDCIILKQYSSSIILASPAGLTYFSAHRHIPPDSITGLLEFVRNRENIRPTLAF